jgi:DNA repair exonuclease SbcCD ATPase subunit
MTPEERAEDNRQRAREWRRKHPDREQASKARYKAANPERWKAQRKATAARYAEKNQEAIRERARAKTAELRAAAIAAYGGKCACPGCHVHHAELLTIDHINGGGNTHRKTIGRGSKDFFRWLQRNNYPPDFQVLCGSCNLAKADKPACPLAGQEH